MTKKTKTEIKIGKTIYLRMDARKRPANAAGMVLGHNHILHDESTPIGLNGFRAFCFYREDRPHFVPCPCGWRPNLGAHYAHKEHVERYDTPRKRANRYREYAGHLSESMHEWMGAAMGA